MIRCYKYWAQPASRKDADLLQQQLRLAGDYRHVLVDIENRARALSRALWATPLRAASWADRRAYFLLRESPKRAKDFPRAKAATVRIGQLLKDWTSSEDYQVWQRSIKAAQLTASTAARTAATAAGLHFGTYWTVEDSVSTAVRTTAWGSDLKHHSQQKVGAPIDASKKPSTEEIASPELRRFRLESDLYALGDSIDGYRGRALGEHRGKSGQVRATRLRRAQIRIGSEGRAKLPVWADLHVLVHRPLPRGRIAQAWAQRHFVGGRAHWEVVIAVELDETTVMAAPARRPATIEGAVSIDIGWRRREDGVRVAYWLGTDGAEGEVVIPELVEQRKGKSDELRSIRDQRQNLIKAVLRDARDANLGTWLAVALAHVDLWKRPGHFVRLERAWRDQRLLGDAGAYALLVEYLKKDRHLHAWQGNNLAKMERQIRGRLDAWAHDLCSRYTQVVIEAFSLTAVKEGAGVVGQIAARSIQQFAPGEIRRALKQAAPRYGAKIVEIAAAYTTITCAWCQHRRVYTAPEQLVLTCDACGESEDQDRTACRNLLAASAALPAKGAGSLAAETADAAAPSKRALGARRNRRRGKEDRSQTV